MPVERAYLGLGCNMGDRERNLSEAVRRLSAAVAIEQLSSLFETDPVGFKNQPRFLNAVVSGMTGLDPVQLLDFVKQVEKDLGRIPSFRNAPRPIDIDILIYGRTVMNTPRLTIPHPELCGRAFVLAPLAEIASGLTCPGTQLTVGELLATLPDVGGVVKFGRLKTEFEKR